MDGVITKISKFYPDGRPQILRCIEDDRTVGVLFRYQKKTSEKLVDFFGVHGQCFDITNNKVLPILEVFDALDDAKTYYNQLIEKHPQSHLHLYKKTVEYLETYT